ncbi:MAG: cobalamin-independent methionine synthase II family protein [Alphaproteobacteria bacterium]|nr:cobalamin-independent methionine synthase II family protein [Alphaproteobacteria bacterium]
MMTTTHVGSLPRSQAVTDLLFAKERKEPYDSALFDATMETHVQEVVDQQAAAGITWVSDGETSKISYATYVKDRYTGFAGDTPRQPPADLQQFPSFLQRLAQSGGTPTYARPACVSAVAPQDFAELNADLRRLRAAIDAHNARQGTALRGFMNAASPGVISLFLPNQYYASRQLYLEALGEALRHEYEAIVAAGFTLQLDCPDLGLSRHMQFAEETDDSFLAIAQMHIDVLNAALVNIPSEAIRLHICWGNYEGPHVCDIEMDKVFPVLMSSKARYLLFETSNPRHGHDHSVFRARHAEIPDDKVLVPGVIDTTTNFVEHPKLVAERLQRFVDIVGKERVIAGTDCGFGTFAGFGAVDPSIAYAKLASLAAGAAMVLS